MTSKQNPLLTDLCNMSVERILYLGYFYPAEVVASRRLPSSNIAGNNRMRRITGALASAGLRVDIVSPGICAKCGLTSKLFYGAYRTHEGESEVTVAPAVVVPLIGAMLEILFFPFWAMLFLRRGRFDGAVFYNYSISFALLAVLFRARGIPYIAQVEDIAVPAKADWKPGSETRPAQQLLYWLCMKVVSGLSVGIWVPSQRFLTFLPRSKPYLVVRGCVADSEWGEDSPARLLTPIRVLFVGKYEIEHGLDLFVAALEFLRSGAPVGRLYEFDCCGTRDYPAELRSLSAGADRPVIRLHGLLSDDEYRKLLAETAVALVLQKGQGRHANLKSPSKAHEFLAAGKLVIATDVGDLALNSGSQLIMLKDESPEELVRIFEDIAKEPEKYEKIALAARKYSRRESSYVAVGTKLVAFLTRAFISSQPRGT